MDELLLGENAQTVSVLHAPAPGGSSWPSSTPGPGLRGLPRNAPALSTRFSGCSRGSAIDVKMLAGGWGWRPGLLVLANAGRCRVR